MAFKRAIEDLAMLTVHCMVKGRIICTSIAT